ncbi:MAG: hypothetical protein JSS43_03210 [Proteobacteria bacterium]|nr:hypothetical protein [Pseudomonadota bacterium]
MKRLLLTLGLLFCTTNALASGGGYSIPWTIDPYGGTPAEQEAFYKGNPGILMGRAPWPRLFAGWRMLQGMPVGAQAGAALSLPCCGGDNAGIAAATQAWLKARSAVPGAVAIRNDYIDVYRPVRDFMAVQTCFPDAFDTAQRTLADRVAKNGASTPWVKVWLDGQDIVFANCSSDADLPPLDPKAPDWLKRDRAYQAAAVALYRRDFAKAQQLFDAIAADAASPWRSMAPYLAARAAVTAALPTQDPELYANARRRLIALAPPTAYGHVDLITLAGALDFRDRSEARRRELARMLTAATLPPNVAADFKDSRRLGQSPPGEPAYLDWLAVFGREPDQTDTAWFEHFGTDNVWKTDADALDHARGRWAEQKQPPWLLAALAWSDPGAAATELTEAAKAIPPDNPAYLTALYHRFRLDNGSDTGALRAELDTALARTDLSQTTRNLLLAERTMVAHDLGDLTRLAPRTSPCLAEDGNPKGCLVEMFGLESLPYSPNRPDVRFGDDAIAVIDRLPLPARQRLAQDETLPAPLRLDVALTSWTRAVLMQDVGTAQRLTTVLQTLLPQLEAEWKAFLAAKTPEDRRFAAWFVLVKMPGLDVDLGGTYTRPQGAVADFEGHWHDWLYAPVSAAAVPAPEVKGDVVCYGMCGPGIFPFRLPAFVQASAGAVARERGQYQPANQKTAGSVWEDLLAYAKAHPKDPRSPEALYWLIRVSRFGSGHNRSSYRAYVLLQARYKGSTWAQKSKYFYD